jgi:UDP-N-acetylmuramoylalanine--D-glutamate ligase
MAYEKQRITVVGLGREGAALARFLTQQGAKVTVTDVKGEETLRDQMDELSGLPIHYLLGGHPEESLEADIIFVSPGVSQNIPILEEARRRGITISSETKLFFSLCQAPIIGITGSSGKTTTTSLVGEIMQAEGYRTFVGGNIGSPLTTIVQEIDPEDKVVMELSSFQLEVLDQSPHIAAILNLSPNHLDRHKSMDDYVAAKMNILRFQGRNDYAVLNADQRLTRELTRECRGQILLFSREREVDEGAFLRQEEITVRFEGKDRKVCHVSEIQLLGAHNLDNVLAACAITTGAGAQVEAMASAITSFSGLEHRLELVGEFEGVRYYNDSIATSPDRAMAALNSFVDPIILLAGGREKHLPLEGLARLIVRRVKSLVLFGEAAPMLEEAVIEAQSEEPGREVPIYHSSNLVEAVHIAFRISRTGDIVLLAPACTSFDMYRDFAERGHHFKALVSELRSPRER